MDIIEDLKAAGTSALETKYRELMGKKDVPTNRTYLIRQLAYRMQELASGEISPMVQDKMQKMIEAYDPINKVMAKTKSSHSASQRDNRLPVPGSFISKVYKGQKIDVKVLEKGFEHDGIIYKNLSAVAEAITGSHWNGFIFFGFKKP